MDKRVKVLISLGILIIIGAGFYLTSYLVTKYTGYTITGKVVYSQQEKIQIAKCLSNKGVVLYCSGLSFSCMRQKKNFGSAFEYLNYIDCGKNENFEQCEDLSLPAWKINNRFYFGIRDLEKLAESSGCKTG